MYIQRVFFICGIVFPDAFTTPWNGTDIQPKVVIFDHQLGIGTKRPLNIAHRGSSGVLPEHTVAAYERAIQDGADAIECDVSITKDLKLVCRHEHHLSPSTNVESLSKFAKRKKWGRRSITDWFIFDFLLEELLELKAKQTYSSRDQSLNEKFTIATFDEFVHVAKKAKRRIGIYLEIKTPAFVNSRSGLFPIGSRFEDIIIQELTKHGYTKKNDRCLISSFEEDSLLYLQEVINTEIPLVAHFSDVKLFNYSDTANLAKKGLYGLFAPRSQIYRHYKDNSYKNYIYETTDFAEKIHALGLKLHIYTFRNELSYLAWDYDQDPWIEYQMFMHRKIDGYFTDFPSTLKTCLDSIYREDSCD